MRIGGSTYSKEPFPKQLQELREAGFDYAEFDLAHVRLPADALLVEATALARTIPLETAHLPPPRFTHDDLARFVGFLDALAPVGTRLFNVHLLEAKASPKIADDVKAAWLGDLVRAARERSVSVTLENVDEPPDVLRKALDAVPDLGFCLDVGHAHLDKRDDGGRAYLEALKDRLALVHVHDNHGGHGKEGDEHLPLGKGTIDVERDVRAVRAAGYDGRLTLEIFAGTPEDKKGALRKLRHWVQ